MGNSTYVFIDSQNLHLGVKKSVYRNGKKVYSGWEIDYKKFYIFLKDKYLGLYRKLNKIGFELVFKETSFMTKNSKVIYKGNIDTNLVLEAMKKIDNYDKAILISGDGDFHCLLDYWENVGKLGRIIIPNRYSYSHLLQKYRHKMDFVNELGDKLKK